ncbi:MAG: M23 family metallopeptidase [Sphingobium sp.]
MTMRFPGKTVAALTMAAAAATTAYAGGKGEDAIIQRGRALSDWTSAESVAALTKAATPGLRSTIESAGGATAFAEAIKGQMGVQTKVLDEIAMKLNGYSFYQRLAAHERLPTGATTVIWDEKGEVVSALIQPAPPPLPAAGSGVPVRLPFAKPAKGSWLTVWGGRNVVRNYHMIAPAQIYAFDLLVARDGRTFDGPQDKLSSYFCWGEPVLAAADGVVSEAVDGLADMPVGQMDPKHVAGNHIVIRHGEKQYSLVAHLQNGSTKVKKGDVVKSGQPIGLCGNSGNTSEPHVHFHLQTGSTFDDGGQGLPAAFRDMTVDGRPSRDGEPVRGQVIVPVR